MEENEIMVNDSMLAETEEIADASSGSGFKVAAGLGLAAAVSVLAYKFVAKPLMAKFKAKKEIAERQPIDAEYVVADSKSDENQEDED